MRTLMLVMAAGALCVFSGCKQSAPAGKNPQAPAAPAPAAAAAPAPAAQTAKAAPKRRLVVDEKGNAYEVLEEHERLCQNCDR